MVTASFPLCLTQGVHPIYPCVSVSIRGPKTKLRKLTERQRKQAIWPRMDTDTHGCGVPASSRSTGRRLEQNCMVMFWRNAILPHGPQAPSSRHAVNQASAPALCRIVCSQLHFRLKTSDYYKNLI